jgi:hypothetical protein
MGDRAIGDDVDIRQGHGDLGKQSSTQIGQGRLPAKACGQRAHEVRVCGQNESVRADVFEE